MSFHFFVRISKFKIYGFVYTVSSFDGSLSLFNTGKQYLIFSSYIFTAWCVASMIWRLFVPYIDAGLYKFFAIREPQGHSILRCVQVHLVHVLYHVPRTLKITTNLWFASRLFFK